MPSSVCTFRNSQRGLTKIVSSRVIFTFYTPMHNRGRLDESPPEKCFDCSIPGWDMPPFDNRSPLTGCASWRGRIRLDNALGANVVPEGGRDGRVPCAQILDDLRWRFRA